MIAAVNTVESDDVMHLARRYTGAFRYRRQVLEQSLVNQSNDYARVRLKHFTKDDWGRLPAADYPVRPVTPADVGKPIPSTDGRFSSIARKRFDKSPSGLRQLGEWMFTRYPAMIVRSMVPVLRKSNGAEMYGLWQTVDSVGGLVWVSLPGGVYPALTCSSCHSSAADTGVYLPGVPNHRMNLGRAKDDYVNRKSLFSTWGPGRMDIAADGTNNPVVIGDVRTVRYQRYLHRTANIKNSLSALAVRLETGHVLAYRKSSRLAPENAFALAQYIWDLGRAKSFSSLDVSRKSLPGKAVFDAHCASCHSNEAWGGGAIDAGLVDSPVATMPNSSRGTGTLNVAALGGVSDRALLLYGGEAMSLGHLLDATRKDGGHYFGQKLSASKKKALIRYLATF